VRPQLNRALALAWRDEQTLQLGADPQTAVVVTGVDAELAAVLDALDGTRTEAELLAAAHADGVDPDAVRHLLDLLARAGALVDAAVVPRGVSPAEARRLAPDVAAWSLTAPPDGAARVLARRRSAVVAVDGAGRVGAALVGLLAAAGVGEVVVRDRAAVDERDVSPGGHRGQAVGQPRSLSALASARACAPSVGNHADRGPRRPRPTLVALCPDTPDPSTGTGERFLAAGLTHVVGTTYERVGVVGPLVRPGRTPCLRCLELHRRDRDRAWPLVAAQLGAAQACDVVLASQVAALLAAAVLAEVDDPAAPHELAGARLELRWPSGRPLLRRWPAHPACGCGWPGDTADTPERAHEGG
jgi:hypothetical protein